MPSLPFNIARRYLFAKKSHKVVNIISAISLLGFCIGTAALVIVLSVFNGFETIITGSYNQFDADLEISPRMGKTMVLSDELASTLNANPNIVAYAEVLEEQALFRYNGKQCTGTVKGVSDNYTQVTGIDSLITQGKFALQKGDIGGAVLGRRLAHTLGAGVRFVNSLVIYAPKRTGKISLSNPESSFITNYFFPTGFFAVHQPEIDNQYVILELKKAQELFQYENEVSAIEIRLSSSEATDKTKAKLKKTLGDDYYILDKFEQKEDLYKMLSMEKWMTFFIIIFILIVAIFNIVGTLSMLIIEKKSDIKTLQSMGASQQFIEKIFISEGRMVAFIGAGLGMAIGVLTCLAQQYFGFISLGSTGQYIVSAYPVEVLPTDLLLIFISVFAIGSVAIHFPVKYICKRFEI